ncbi:hypothetical protein [Nonomuraea sp. NPDC050786]|uniref:hypothetical protein n=1 Tax=Nonomuraea sp. NPDC050786 TaxID=3154840 RepID=UPI00340CA44A
MLITFLGAWFAAATIKQEPTRRLEWHRKIDPGGLLLPEWRFFAPHPGVHDNNVLYRDELEDGELTPWKEITSAVPRKIRHIFWLPEHRIDKVIFDLAGEVSNTILDGKLESPEDIQLSLPYLFLLNHVTHNHPHHPRAIRTQFLIARSAGWDESEEPLIVFYSNLHPIKRSTVRPGVKVPT